MIKNKTKKTILCKNKTILKSVFSKALGLMFHSKIEDTGYVFVFSKARKQSLHMFFVFFSIDVLFIDQNKKIVEIKENIKPFTFYNSKEKAKYVVELPKGLVKKSKTKVGDRIIF